jgi:hypothetical protein
LNGNFAASCTLTEKRYEHGEKAALVRNNYAALDKRR